MQRKITTFLTFTDEAEHAAEVDTSVFENSRIVSAKRARPQEAHGSA